MRAITVTIRINFHANLAVTDGCRSLTIPDKSPHIPTPGMIINIAHHF